MPEGWDAGGGAFFAPGKRNMIAFFAPSKSSLALVVARLLKNSETTAASVLYPHPTSNP